VNILFTCGGTAGHINPAVALARLFQARQKDCHILFVGADGGMETRLVPKEGYEIRTVTITNFQRALTPSAIGHNLRTLENMAKSRRQADDILDDFRPDLVVGTGGYASYPVVHAAARRGVPTAVHESNAVPGLTTKALARVVDLVMVGFEDSRAHYDHPEKVAVTGTPVRGDFFQYTRKEARARLGYTDDRPLLLSFFGSLGATVMNGYMTDILSREVRMGAPFRHIHGAGRDCRAMRARLEGEGLMFSGDGVLPPPGEGAPTPTGVELREYIYDMPLCMAAADLIVCRAGASTIAELTAIARPAVLIPSPNVTNDHQTKNARVLADQGAALLMTEQECGGGTDALFDTLSDLLRSPGKRSAMSRALSAMAVPDAAEKIYLALLGLLK